MEKIAGVHVQRLTIRYNRIGTLNIPEALPALEMPKALMRTREGVRRACEPVGASG